MPRWPARFVPLHLRRHSLTELEVAADSTVTLAGTRWKVQLTLLRIRQPEIPPTTATLINIYRRAHDRAERQCGSCKFLPSLSM